MTYDKKTWVSGEVINTHELNNIEDAIDIAHSQISVLQDKLSPDTSFESIYNNYTLSAGTENLSAPVVTNNANYLSIPIKNDGTASSITAYVYVNYEDGGTYNTEPSASDTVPAGNQHFIQLMVDFYSLKIKLINNDSENSAVVTADCKIVWNRYDVNGVSVYDADLLDGYHLEDIQNEIDNDIGTHDSQTTAHGVTGTVLGSELLANADGIATLDVNAQLPLDQLPPTLTDKDADTVDGYHIADIVRTSQYNGTTIIEKINAETTTGLIDESMLDSLVVRDDDLYTQIANHTAITSAHHTRPVPGANITEDGSHNWNVVQGDGSELDADLLDGYHYLDIKNYVDSKIQGLEWRNSVKSILDTPPTSPAVKDRYIIGVGSADWSGHDDEIAEWDGSAWVFYTPNEGSACWVENTDMQYTYNGTEWTVFATSADHNNLVNLSSDDHIQYYNAARLNALKNTANGIVGLDNSALIPLAQLPNTLTGKDADTLDGAHLTDIQSDISTHASDVDAHHTKYTNSEAVAAINAETSLTVDINGDADTVDGYHASDLGSNVSDDGTIVVNNATDINFGNFLSVTDDGDGTVTVNAQGGTDADTVDGAHLVDIQNEIDGDVSTHANNATAHHDNSNDPTSLQKAGLDAANSPDAANAFATINDVPTDYVPAGDVGVANGVAELDNSALIPLAQLPNTLTGKDADTLDGAHLSDIQSDISTHASDVDAHHTKYTNSEAVAAINAETFLTVDINGDADTVDGYHASDLGSNVSNNGTIVVNNATDINFGEGILVTDDGDGTVTVTPDGGGASGFERVIEGEIYTAILMYYRIPEDIDISEARATLSQLPTGSSVKVDVRKNGTETTDSIFSSDTPIEITTSQSAESSGLYSSTGSLDSGKVSCVAGDVLYVVVTQVGSDIPGTDLSAQVIF